MSSNYYYAVNGKRQGPVTLDELKLMAAREDLKRSDLVWTEGMPAWQPAGSEIAIFQGLPPDLEPDTSVRCTLPANEPANIFIPGKNQQKHESPPLGNIDESAQITLPPKDNAGTQPDECAEQLDKAEKKWTEAVMLGAQVLVDYIASHNIYPSREQWNAEILKLQNPHGTFADFDMDNVWTASHNAAREYDRCGGIKKLSETVDQTLSRSPQPDFRPKGRTLGLLGLGTGALAGDGQDFRPKGRTLGLLGVLISIVAGLIIYRVNKQIQEAKWEREAPQREAAWELSVISNSEDYGSKAGEKMCLAGLATGIMRARTESEISQLANYMWSNPNNEKLRDVCGGTIRATGGDFETAEAKASFVSGFVQSYIGEINAFKQRNQPLY